MQIEWIECQNIKQKKPAGRSTNSKNQFENKITQMKKHWIYMILNRMNLTSEIILRVIKIVVNFDGSNQNWIPIAAAYFVLLYLCWFDL